MIYQVLFGLSLVAIVVCCVVAASIIVRRPLKPFARNLLLFLIIFEIITAVLHLYAISNRGAAFWDWFFDLQYEFNLGSIFSALQFFVIAAVALLSAWMVPTLKLGHRFYWLLLTVLFIYLGIDEFYSIHETLGDGRTVTEYWRIPYAIGGMVLALTTALAFWFGFRRNVRLFVLLFMGFGIMGVAGVAIEEFVMQGFVYVDPSTEWLYVFEEVFEMVGATIVLAALVAYLQEQVDGRRWQVAKGALMAATVGSLGWLLFALLFQNGLEARYAATPLDVRYENGLSLVGYRLTPDHALPGSEVALTLYWRADEPLPENYSISLHALSHPDIDSVAQSDDLHLGPTPSTSWFPGVVMKRTVYLLLPDDLPTPESYWLLLRVWFGPWPLGRPWEDTTGLPLLSSGDRAQISSDALIIDHVSALPEEAPPVPPVAADYRFTADGFTLSGYDVPQQATAGEALTVAFWWQAARDGERDLTQFFHLVPADGGETVAFDGQPFGGSFPTADWIEGMTVRDRREIDLPETLAAGRYDVYTGLYAADTGARAAVVEAGGDAVLNNAIALGQIEILPAGG